MRSRIVPRRCPGGPAGAMGSMRVGTGGLWVDLGEHLRDLLLRSEAGALDHLRVVRAAQIRRDHQQAGEMDLAAGDDAAERRVLVHQAGGLGATGMLRPRSCAARTGNTRRAWRRWTSSSAKVTLEHAASRRTLKGSSALDKEVNEVLM